MTTGRGRSRPEERAGRWMLVSAAVAGTAAFCWYYLHGLTIAHFDAKAHLVVARRLIDSLSPGYSQMGAHWLPLIHLLYLPLVAFDAQYRTGLLPSLLSVSAFALSGWRAFRISHRVTGSIGAGIFATLLLTANPNLLYLQSAPLTEPVFLALFLSAVDGWFEWHDSGRAGLPWRPALWTALAGLCRYEGWYLAAGVGALFAWDFITNRIPKGRVVRAAALSLGVFALPALAHFGYIYLRLRDSFFQHVARGSAAPYESYHRPMLSLWYHLGELGQVAAVVPLVVGFAGAAVWFADRKLRTRSAPLLLLWIPSLVNVSALYWGLIYRVRYSALLLPALAIFGSLTVTSEKRGRNAMLAGSMAVFLLPWLSWAFPHDWAHHFLRAGPGMLYAPAAALVLLLAALAVRRYRWPLLLLAVLEMNVPVLEGELHPMLDEALEHRYLEPERARVLDCLKRGYDGSKILIDMGRLAPLIYDSGLPVREFVYNEGDMTLWKEAQRNPAEVAGWLCAERGDEVWNLLRVDPRRLDAYSLAVQTKNFVVYRRKSGAETKTLLRSDFEPAGRKLHAARPSHRIAK